MTGTQTDSTLGAGLKRQIRPACALVLFGATGDLAAKKIAPALYNLAADGMLADGFVVLGVARRPRTDEQFRQEMLQAIQTYSRQPLSGELWSRLGARWHYQQTAAQDAPGYRSLATRLAELDARNATGSNHLFYLASTPDTFSEVIANLGATGLAKPAAKGAFSRLIVEKPFGHDMASACELNRVLLAQFDESQVYRIDHYLGKETVLNILAMRFANAIFEPMLNRRTVDHVQITVAETVGMEGRRGPYYENAGALRDMVQNHLLQLVALTAMDGPARLVADDIRSRRLQVLRSLRPMSAHEVAVQTVRGQYAAGKDTPAYRQEKGVSPESQVETFVALKLFIDNERWSGVPFHLRTGKYLAAKASQIVIVFKHEPMNLFGTPSCDLRGPNRLVIRIFPNEGMNLVFDAKLPGPDMMLRPVNMDFRYASSFEWASPEAYEHLLLDAMLGEATLFVCRDEVEAAWRLTDSIRTAWEGAQMPKLVLYEPHTWGPPQAQTLLGEPYLRWY